MDGTTNQHKWPKKVEEVPGVPFRVTLLRDKGRKITRKEMEDFVPLEGLLTIERGGMGVVYRRVANLVRSSSSMPIRVCSPLFEPDMEMLNSKGLILRGHENEMVDGSLVQHVQVWLCVPILPGDSVARSTGIA